MNRSLDWKVARKRGNVTQEFEFLAGREFLSA